MDISVMGVNHKTASVDIREKLAFTEKELEAASLFWQEDARIAEALIISTCNRTEFYTVGRNDCGDAAIFDMLLQVKHLRPEQINRCVYRKQGQESVRHLLRVTSGLDSMILGETQILGQVKEAYQNSDRLGLAGRIVHALCRQALTCGKRVQSETAINHNAASVSYAAVELARKIFVRLEDKVLVVIGAGQMSELTVLHLHDQGARKIYVLNRTRRRAENLARQFQGAVMDYTQIDEALGKADIVITSTGAPHYVIKRSQMEKAMRHRKGKPIFMIDIAVPRDIDPEINYLENAYLYDIDDLQAVVAANMKAREEEARTAERIVEEELTEFLVWYKTQGVVPLIAALRQKAENIRQAELSRTFHKLSGLNDKEKKSIDNLTRSIVNQILREPVLRIKEFAVNDKSDIYFATLCQLFDLEDEFAALPDPITRPDRKADEPSAGAK